MHPQQIADDSELSGAAVTEGSDAIQRDVGRLPVSLSVLIPPLPPPPPCLSVLTANLSQMEGNTWEPKGKFPSKLLTPAAGGRIEGPARPSGRAETQDALWVTVTLLPLPRKGPTCKNMRLIVSRNTEAKWAPQLVLGTEVK